MKFKKRLKTVFLFFCFLVPGWAEDGMVSVMAYNVHGWEPTNTEFETLVQESGAEILGLTEAWNANQNQSRAELIGYHVIYGGIDTPEGDNGSFNVGGYYMPATLMSKHPIVEYHLYDAHQVEGHEDPDSPVQLFRGSVLAKIAVPPSDTVYVWVLHLNPWHGDFTNGLRLEEITGVIDVLDSLQDYPVVIMGDFNMITREDTDCGLQGESCTLESEFLVAEYIKDNGYFDTYRELYPDVNTDLGTTNSDGRIDYVFINDKMTALESFPLEEGVFGSQGYNMSDHLAQYAELEFNSVAVPGCTDSAATNFNPEATEDDGSCEFEASAGQLRGPGPITDQIFMPQGYPSELKKHFSGQQIEIFNLNGERAVTIEKTGQSAGGITLNQLNRGVYFLRVKGVTFPASLKLVIY